MQVRVVALVAALVALASAARADGTSDVSPQGVVASIESAQGRIARLLRAARTQRDDSHAVCANDGLSRANAALRHARVDARDWSAARVRNDAEAARRAMLRLGVDRDSARRASADVDVCFGVDRGADDRTEVTLVVDPG